MRLSRRLAGSQVFSSGSARHRKIIEHNIVKKAAGLTRLFNGGPTHCCFFIGRQE
jgi:hypothetical protein